MNQKRKVNFYSRWIVCIGLVKFDIDEGQVVERLYPPDSLSIEQQKQLSLLSFPDSNSIHKDEGQATYLFCMSKNKISNLQLFGFTLFMQRKDPLNPRGYTQKSIVIVTSLPLLGFFKNIIYIISQKTENLLNLQEVLEKCSIQINNWQQPKHNSQFNLNFFENQIYVEIPYYMQIEKIPITDGQQIQKIQISNEENKQNEFIQQEISQIKFQKISPLELSQVIHLNDKFEKGQFQEADIFSILYPDKIHLLPKLWEFAITNQSFMVVSDLPNECSEFILGCLSLISPLTFTGEYRPYFTIYHSEFQQIQQEIEKFIFRNILLGVTNPFFLKALKNFPIIIRLDKGYMVESNNKNNQIVSNIVTNKQIFIGCDKQIQKMLIPVKNRETQAINNSLVKKLYRNLTLDFIGVFEIYFLNQYNVNLTFHKKFQDIKKFEEKEFYEFLKTQKFTFQEMFENKQKIIKLYEAFIRSANFLAYIKGRGNVYFSKGNILF